MGNIYYITENNFDGTASTYRMEGDVITLTGKIKWPPDGIEPPKPSKKRKIKKRFLLKRKGLRGA